MAMAKAMARRRRGRGRGLPVTGWLVLGAALVGVVLSPAPGRAAGSDCVTAPVSAPIRMPDGSLHGPGELSLCVTMDYSPVASLHVTRVDGRRAAMVLSRRAETAATGDRPEVLFHRQPDGSLLLRGYAVPRGSRTVTYLLEPGLGSPEGIDGVPPLRPDGDLVLASRLD